MTPPRRRRAGGTPRTLLLAADIADVLGVSPRRVHQLTKQAGFPAPYAVSPSTARRRGVRMWRPQDIETWSQTERRPGRPPKPNRKDHQ